MKLLTMAAAAVFVSAGMASAASVDFDFAKNPAQELIPNFSMSSGGIGVTVSGMSCDDGAGPNDGSCQSERIDRWQNGVGIDIVRNGNFVDSSHQVDGYGRDEFVMVEYTKEVVLESVSFNYYTDNDDFNLFTWVAGSWVDVGEFDACTSGCTQSWIERTFTFASEYSGMKFLIGAVGSDDDWKFRSTIVSEKISSPPAVVPLPAAGWLLLGGLGGMAGLRARRKS